MGGQPRPNHLQGWPAITWPLARGRPTMAKAPYTGADRLRPACRGGKRLRAQSIAARRSQGRPAVGWRPQRVARPQGSVARGEATGATPARDQLAEGRRPSPAQGQRWRR
ncbi:hypothetical protein BHM03_00056993 [Ensete ventricosum]|nr:hypothetical protein BHM03_00056993 [Ensete ventricosum]